MKFLNNLKVSAKIVLLSSALLVCLAIVAVSGIVMLRQIEVETSILYNNSLLGVSSAKEANIQLINISRGVRNMALVKPEMRPNYIVAYNDYVARGRAELAKVRPLLLSAEGVELHAKTTRAFEALLPQLQKIIDNMANMSTDEIMNGLIASRQYANVADDLMTELCDYLTARAEVRATGIAREASNAFWLALAMLGVALFIGTVLGVMIKRAIANPLVEIAAKATRVASGDLEQDFSLDRKDELGSLAVSLDQMVINLRERIAEAEQRSREAAEQNARANEAMLAAYAAQEVAESGQKAILVAAKQVDLVVGRLSAATEELSAQVEQSSRGTDMQRERVAAAATAMEEMNSTVLEVARNAGVAADGSGKARERAVLGEDIVNQSVSAIGTVQADTEELRRYMEKLGSQAEAIGSIMIVISDIADQTNLLALNAAIEAARAGEAGRGFAVVADEVRKLAEKTMTATKEVGDAINGIQTGTRQSVAAVERATEDLHATTALVKQSGEALGLIVQEVEVAAAQISSIATAAEQQSATSEEITGALDEINRMAGETAMAMHQSAQAVAELASQTQELQRLVNNLRAEKPHTVEEVAPKAV